MLQELFVKDFAIIDSLRLSFLAGLNILTGETGAGKSIIVGALGLLMGGRASSDLIRTGEEEAVVEAVFDIRSNGEIKKLLASCDIPSEDDQLIIRRTISRSGKNRILIGNRLATIQMLSQLGGRLIDISGQYSQQLLLQPERHIDILDSFGGAEELRSRYQKLYAAFQDRAGELKALATKDKERAQQRELLDFQNSEITGARLTGGEEEELSQEKHILASSKMLYGKAMAAYGHLYENDHACLTVLKQLIKELQEPADIDSEIVPLKKSLENALLQLEDTAFSLRSYAKKITVEPGRLDAIEARLDEIYRLKKKYGSSIEQILAYHRKIQKELEVLEGSSTRIDEIRGELAECGKNLWALAEELSGKRKKAALQLKKKIEAELATIGMKKAAFFARIHAAERAPADKPEEALQGLNSCGMDAVEFFISPNQGEEPKPLSRIASGGEISRIVLAIKKIIAAHYGVPTLLFDEVDAGIGGAVAEAVGKKLKEIADSHQVLCITHLPQIACFGRHHYTVKKTVSGGRTVTSVECMDDRGRLDEVARMLGGKSISEKTKAHALEMLQNASKN